jgi:hypothetical protein
LVLADRFIGPNQLVGAMTIFSGFEFNQEPHQEKLEFAIM